MGNSPSAVYDAVRSQSTVQQKKADIDNLFKSVDPEQVVNYADEEGKVCSWTMNIFESTATVFIFDLM